MVELSGKVMTPCCIYLAYCGRGSNPRWLGVKIQVAYQHTPQHMVDSIVARTSDLYRRIKSQPVVTSVSDRLGLVNFFLLIESI